MAATMALTPRFVLGGPRLAPLAPATASPRRSDAAVYRRRRLVVAALFLGVLLAGSWTLSALGGGALTASRAESRPTVISELDVQPVSLATHVVVAGDTLWSIARRLQPDGDVRPLVDALAASRQGRALQVGERITLPAQVLPGR